MYFPGALFSVRVNSFCYSASFLPITWEKSNLTQTEFFCNSFRHFLQSFFLMRYIFTNKFKANLNVVNERLKRINDSTLFLMSFETHVNRSVGFYCSKLKCLWNFKTNILPFNVKCTITHISTTYWRTPFIVVFWVQV